MESDYQIQDDTIIFSNHFNSPLTEDLILAIQNSNCHTLIFQTFFNQDITHIPENITRLTTGWNFNINIDNLHDKIEFLDLGHCFQTKINKFPKNLKYLRFDSFYNYPLDNLPDGLKVLMTSSCYNYPLDNLPNSLEYLVCGCYFNQPINNLPQSLKCLVLEKNFNQPLNNLPPNLKELIICCYFYFDRLKPSDLRRYSEYESNDNSPKSQKKPNNDEDINDEEQDYIFFDGDSMFNNSIDNLPDSIENLVISATNFYQPINKLPKNLKYFQYWFAGGWEKEDYKMSQEYKIQMEQLQKEMGFEFIKNNYPTIMYHPEFYQLYNNRIIFKDKYNLQN